MHPITMHVITTAPRVALRGNRLHRRTEGRLVFVVGSPPSGTSFVGEALGSQPGFVDLGEVPLLKAAAPELAALPAARPAPPSRSGATPRPRAARR